MGIFNFSAKASLTAEETGFSTSDVLSTLPKPI